MNIKSMVYLFVSGTFLVSSITNSFSDTSFRSEKPNQKLEENLKKQRNNLQNKSESIIEKANRKKCSIHSKINNLKRKGDYYKRSSCSSGQVPGEDNDLAINSIFNLTEIVPSTPDSIIETTQYGPIDNNKLMIFFDVNTTVLEINQALDSIGATIYRMKEGFNYLSVVVPTFQNQDELLNLEESLSSTPGILSVIPSFIPKPLALPENPSFQGGNNFNNALKLIKDQLAIGMHGVWNAKNSISNNKPVIVIVDFFGRGPINSDNINNWGFNILNEQDLEEINCNENLPCDHGYAVASVIGATHSDDDVNLISGILPATQFNNDTLFDVAFINILDQSSSDWIDTLITRLRTLVVDQGRNVVLNLSFGLTINANGTYPNVDTTELSSTIDMFPGFEDKIFIATGAGNEGVDSRFASIFNILANDSTGNGDNSLNNIVITESWVAQSRIDNNLFELFEPACLSSESNMNLTGLPNSVGAIGGAQYANGDLNGRVNTYLGPNGIEALFQGTSFSAPQVSGIAAYMWSIDPTLSATNIKNKIIETSNFLPQDSSIVGIGQNGVGCHSNVLIASPFINAYEAILSIDDDSVLSLSSPSEEEISNLAPVRLSILDIASDNDFVEKNPLSQISPDGKFTEADIYYFLEAEKEAEVTGGLPYSRYDLNSDGAPEFFFSFGGKPVNLNANSPSEDSEDIYSLITQTIEGLEVIFDESNVSDLDVLCYYAYSPLYIGNHIERQLLLLDKFSFCGNGILIDKISVTIANDGVASPTGFFTPSGGFTWNLPRTVVYDNSVSNSIVPFPRRNWFGNNGFQDNGQFFSLEARNERASFIPLIGDPVGGPLSVPRPEEVLVPIANNRSSFLAARNGEVWINITGVFRSINSGNIWEPQTRIYLGEPGNREETSSVEIGNFRISLSTLFSKVFEGNDVQISFEFKNFL